MVAASHWHIQLQLDCNSLNVSVASIRMLGCPLVGWRVAVGLVKRDPTSGKAMATSLARLFVLLLSDASNFFKIFGSAQFFSFHADGQLFGHCSQ